MIILGSVLHHKHHRCGAVVARLAVNFATLIWSVVVLVKPNALAPTAYGPMLTRFASEDLYAIAFGTLSICMLYRIFRQSPPNPIGILAYGALLLAWGFVWAAIVFVADPLQPTATATVSTIFVLAFYGFVANPKRGSDAPGSQ